MNDETNEIEIGKVDPSRLANLTPDEIKELAAKLAKDMIALGDVRITEQALPCAVCDTPRATHTTLVGGYNTTLCQNDRNRWHKYVENAPAMSSLGSAELRLRIAVFKGEETAALGFHAGVTNSKKELYELARKWVEFNGQ